MSKLRKNGSMVWQCEEKKRKLTHLAFLIFLMLTLSCAGAWSQDSSPLTSSQAQKRRPDIPAAEPYAICLRDRAYRLQDSMSDLSDKEIAEYKKRAAKGDVHAMYFLTRVLQTLPDGTQTKPYYVQWFDKALAQKYSLALLDKAQQDLADNKISQEEFLKVLEAAAQSSGGPDEAWLLAYLYSGEKTQATARFSLPPDPNKALQWLVSSAEHGHDAAAEKLCIAYRVGDAPYGITPNTAKATSACFDAAGASCSSASAYALSELFREGKGVDRNAVESRYWKRIADERAAWNRQNQGEYQRFPIAMTAEQAEAHRRYRGRLGLPTGPSSEPGPSICEKDRKYRMQDAMADIPETELAGYEKAATQGDSDAMYFLMIAARHQTRVQPPRLDFAFWRGKAAEAGHPDAIAHRESSKPNGLNSAAAYAAYLSPAEQWAATAGGIDSAWYLSQEYLQGRGSYEPYVSYLHADKKKSIYWKKQAAEYGHIPAAEHLCGIYSVGSPFPYEVSADAVEARHWCFRAARAECSSAGAAKLFNSKGLGTLQNDIEERYWNSVWKERFQWALKQKGEYLKQGLQP